MEDSKIIELYWRRDEAAIAETERRYGTYCYAIAKNILSLREDAEECVSDTFHRAWEAMPPERPAKLGAWLGRVTRNLAINLWSKNHAHKRYDGLTQLLSELGDCVPSPQNPERTVEEKELSAHISLWLRSLEKGDRVLFVRRYWHGDALRDLAAECGIGASKLAQRMYKLRLSLKDSLEKEGYML